MCRPVHHIGDKGKHLEELEQGTSHHVREMDSIPALCGGNVSGEAFGQSQCRYQGMFQDKTSACEIPREGVRDSISAICGGPNVLQYRKDFQQFERV